MVSQVVNLAHEARVQTLYHVQHDPNQDDDAIAAKHADDATRPEALVTSPQLVTPHETKPVRI